MTQVVVLNGKQVNFDHQLDWHEIAADVVVYETSAATQIIEWSQEATILVTKELSMPGDLIWRLPKSVKMIVEAGTGYNFDMATLREQHIMLTNIPEYSTQRVVHTAIMLMLSLASSLQTQIKMLALGNHANFEQHLMVDHGELNGKTLGVIGYGHIWQAIIKIAQAMGMNILVATRTPRTDIDWVFVVERQTTLRVNNFEKIGDYWWNWARSNN